jgi:hypothetical protein
MANNRLPIFELHIRPMFRMVDRVHMLRLGAGSRIDLHDYQQIRDKHVEILDLLTSGNPMPPPPTGGPWPQEWIDLFTRWTQTGFNRLSPGTGSNFQLVRTTAERYALSCSVTIPNQNARAWFDVVMASADAQRYELVIEDVPGGVPSPVTIEVEERIRGPLSTSEVIVVDSAGDHALAVPLV